MKQKNDSLQDTEINSPEVQSGILSKIAPSSDQPLLLYDRDGNIIWANNAAETLLGLGKRDLFNFRTIDPRYKIYRENGRLFQADELPHMQAVRSGQTIHNVILHLKDNTNELDELWLSVTSVPHPTGAGEQAGYVLSFITDITLLKNLERSLSISEQKREAILQALSDSLLILSAEGQINECKGCQQLAPADTSLAGKNISEVLPPGIAQNFLQALHTSLRTGDLQVFEFHLVNQSDEHDYQARVIRIAREECLCLVRDITEQKRYKIDLQKSEKKFRILLESAAQAIVLVDMHGQITLVNKTVEELFGFSRDELVGSYVEILVPPRHRDAHRRFRSIFMRNPVARQMGQGIELTGLHKDGREFPVEISLSHVELHEGFFVMALITDVSERKKLEDKLRQVEKLEAIGQLAGGIAHDFNNVLAGVIGLAELALRRLPKDHPAGEHLGLIISKSESAADLVRKLLAFSRQQVLAPRHINLNDIIRNNKKLLQRYLGEDIRLTINLDKKLQLIKADSTAMDQIITNLSINARDAMPDGGRLTIRTENVPADHPDLISRIPGNSQPFVRLSVEDTGIGMRSDVQRHIFEPFFTTKELGEGTGLGLATVYGLVEQHQGIVHFESEPGEGTTFYLFFPAAQGTLQEENRNMPKKIPGGHETILLVDDEVDIIKTTKATLEHYGYRVFIASNGLKAMKIFEQHMQEIALVISDVVMPHMGGIEMRLNFERMKPDIKFLMMSAFSNRIDRSQPFIEKPFLADHLALKVRQVLDGA